MRKSKTQSKKKQTEPAAAPPEGDAAATDNADTPTPGVDAAPQVNAPVDVEAVLRAKVEKLEDSLLRARAEYQNFQRRAAIERSEAIRYANAGLMKSLLSVVDDLERAVSSPGGESGTVDEGVRLVYENLLKALREHGLETISTGTEPFDPSVHEALMQKPSADHPSGTILEEFAKGYRLGDRVLRPSKVVVSKAVEVKDDGQGEATAAGETEPAKQG